jgi:hypothetical protein
MERWFSTGKRRSPVTNQVLASRSTALTPNRVLKTQIAAYRRAVGSQLLRACHTQPPTADAYPTAEAAAEAAAAGAGPAAVAPGSVRALTALSLAAYVDAGADLDVRDGDGNTPLLLLLQGGRLGLVRELVASGARASGRNDLGTAAVDLVAKLAAADPLTPVEGLDDPTKVRAATLQAWHEVGALLEDAATREAAADGEALRVRNGRAAAQRLAQSGLEGQEANEAAHAANAANGGVAVASREAVQAALAQAHIGPGVGFFPSLFALQFTCGLTPPLARRDLQDAVGLGEQAKLRRVDKVLKAVATVLLLYVLVFV